MPIGSCNSSTAISSPSKSQSRKKYTLFTRLVPKTGCDSPLLNTGETLKESTTRLSDNGNNDATQCAAVKTCLLLIIDPEQFGRSTPSSIREKSTLVLIGNSFNMYSSLVGLSIENEVLLNTLVVGVCISKVAKPLVPNPT